jgi:hypothetical protein
VLGYSRDGWSWHRPDRRAFCPVSEKFGDWNYANVQSAGGCCVIAGDRLLFYVSGRGGVPGTFRTRHLRHRPRHSPTRRLRFDGGRRDGGHADHAPGDFNGRHLFVNLDAPEGELRAEVLDPEGRPLIPFTQR